MNDHSSGLAHGTDAVFGGKKRTVQIRGQNPAPLRQWRLSEGAAGGNARTINQNAQRAMRPENLFHYHLPLQFFAHVKCMETGAASFPGHASCSGFGGGMLKVGTADVSA